MDEEKRFQGLLNGLVRRIYYDEGDEITESFLNNQIYPDLTEEQFKQIFDRNVSLIKSIASADMDFNQLDAFLTSQTRRKEGAITAEQSKAYIKFWKTHKNKVHEKMVSQSIWSNRLKNICWRIDIKSQTRSSDQINTPTAIMELQFSNNRKKDDDVLTFEMDESKLSSVLSSLQEIEGKLNSYQTHE